MKKNPNSIVITAMLSAFIATHVAAETSSSVNVEFGTDEDQGTSQYIDTDLGLNSGAHLMFGYGTSTYGLDNTESESLYAGISSDPYADTAAALTYSNQTEKNNFEINGLRLDLMLNTEDWAFTLSPEIRNVTLSRTTLPDVTITSPGLGAVASYYGLDPVFITLGRTVYSYDQEPSGVSGRTGMFSRMVSRTTSNESIGLDDYRNLFGFGFNFGHGKVGYKHVVSGSSLDNTKTITNSAYISYKFNENWRTQFTAGNTNDSSTTVYFTSLALGYYW